MKKEVEGEEPLTLSQDTLLNEATMQGVQSESTPSSSLEEEFVVSNDDPSNEPSQHVRRGRPQRQQMECPQDLWIATKEVERATVAFLEEPQNIEEPLTCENSKEWECAMQKEYDSLMANNTWTLEPIPASRKPVSCKWVFKIKQGVNGEVPLQGQISGKTFDSNLRSGLQQNFCTCRKVYIYSLYSCIGSVGRQVLV
jgi:hypothetical protein